MAAVAGTLLVSAGGGSGERSSVGECQAVAMAESRANGLPGRPSAVLYTAVSSHAGQDCTSSQFPACPPSFSEACEA